MKHRKFKLFIATLISIITQNLPYSHYLSGTHSEQLANQKAISISTHNTVARIHICSATATVKIESEANKTG